MHTYDKAPFSPVLVSIVLIKVPFCDCMCRVENAFALTAHVIYSSILILEKQIRNLTLTLTQTCVSVSPFVERLPVLGGEYAL